MMYAVKFKANVNNGFIKVPDEYSDLESKYVEVVAMVQDQQNETSTFLNKLEDNSTTDEYLLENWQELVSIGLSGFDAEYYKSDQFKEDRGQYLAEKYK